LNLLYEQLREENKIFEIKEVEKVTSVENFRDSNASIMRKESSYISNFHSVHNNNHSNILLKIKNENKIEWFMYANRFLKRLRDTEFII
jgi:hypothetical protein